MTTLYIRHPAKADGDGALCQFALVADGGALLQQGTGAAKGLGDVIGASRRVVLLLAAADVTLLHVKVPPLSAARLKAALPNLVEDQILSDPFDCVLVAAPAQSPDGMRTIAVVQRAWIESVVKSLLAQGARSIAVLPAQLCVPIAPGNVSAVIGAHEITLRHALYAGLGLAIAAPPALSLQAVRSLAGDTPLTLYVAPDQVDAYRALAQDATPAITIEAERWEHWISASKTTTLDLLPGLGAAGANPHNWQRWRWPLRIALLAVIVNLVCLNVQWLRLKREADGVRMSMLQIFKAAYPKETVILDPVAQMRKNIERAKSSTGQIGSDEFTYLAAAFGEASATLGRKPGVASIDYKDRSLTVKYKPETVDPTATEQIKAALSMHGLSLSEPGAAMWKIESTGVKK